MRMLNETKELLSGKRVLFAFSDPAGAKAILSMADACSRGKEHFLFLSDRYYDFYSDFGITVLSFSERPAGEWIEKIKPDILITATSYPANIELSLIEECKAINIKTISFIDHWTNLVIRFLRNGKMILPEKILVIDKVAKDKAVAEGIPEAIIEVSGNPYHSYLKKWKPRKTRDMLMATDGLTEKDRYILFVPEPLQKFDLDKKYGFSEFDGIEDLLAIVENSETDDQIKIIIKMHPNHNRADFERYKHPRLIFTKNTNVNELIFFSECVAGFFSNALLDAFYMDKKVIRMLNRIKNTEIDPFNHLNGMSTCYDTESIAKAIQYIL